MPLENIKSIIAVSSCKGGVGKSTLAALLSQELGRRGLKVGLVDADIYGPSIPTLFQIQNPSIKTNEKKQLIPIEKNFIKIMSFGFLLGDGPAVMRGPMVTRYVQQILHNTAWGELDYLIIDMPPGTGDIQLTITQSVKLSGSIIVTTRQSLSLVDVARGILMFEKVNVPVLGIIENMSYFICDNCEKKHYIFGKGELKNLQDRFGLKTIAQIPILPQKMAKMDTAINNEHISQAVDSTLNSLDNNVKMDKQNPEIQFNHEQINIRWPDGTHSSVNNRLLRLSCQCALCIDEITNKKLLQEENIKSDIAPREITPLGNYAIGIAWNDGHSSGIYPYKNIKKIAS